MTPEAEDFEVRRRWTQVSCGSGGWQWGQAVPPSERTGMPGLPWAQWPGSSGLERALSARVRGSQQKEAAGSLPKSGAVWGCWQDVSCRENSVDCSHQEMVSFGGLCSFVCGFCSFTFPMSTCHNEGQGFLKGESPVRLSSFLLYTTFPFPQVIQ